DVGGGCARRGISGMEETNIAAALPDANHDLLSRPPVTWFALVTTLDTADIALVYFDCTCHWNAIGLSHGGSDSVAQIPRCFVAHTQDALHLIGTHSLARFAEQQCSDEPFAQGQMGIVENRVGRCAELVIALRA